MDSESRLLEEVKKYIPFIQDDFLISITNKGIVNRSRKDLEKIRDTISLSINEKNELQGQIAQEVTVTLSENIAKSTCSCPAQNICKHIITVLLYVKDFYDSKRDSMNLEESAAQSQKENTKDYEALFELTEETAIALIGKKDYNSFVRSIEIKPEATFDYGDLLTVTIKSQNAKVYFPKENSIENVLCSCKEKGFCKHKGYAIVSFLMQERKLNLQTEDDAVEIGESEEKFLLQLKEYVGALLDRGLAGLTENEIQNTQRLYQKAYGMKFFHLANECKNLSSELALYFSKNISFSSSVTLHLICLLYNRSSALLANKKNDMKKFLLAGKRREESFLLDNLTFVGLGASCRLTQRKDLLISGYFYCKELNSIRIMSTLRPFENQITPEYLFHAGLVWSDNLSFHQVCSSVMILRDAKMTSGKLSSSKSTDCKIKGATTQKDFAPIVIEDYSILKEKLRQKSYQYFEFTAEADRIFLVAVDKIDKTSFDKVAQKLNFISYDKQGAMIQFSIKYSAVTENVIRFFERQKNTSVFTHILGSITEKNDSLLGTFLCGISNNEKIHTVYFKEH